MNTESPSLRTIFNEALDIPDPLQRAGYLARACAGDDVLRRRIENLLAADQAAGGFLATTAHSAEPPSTAGPGTAIGRYKLLEQIGEGGCGVVFVAEQTEPVRRRVALKLLKPGLDSRSVIARFEAERQALALMDHPNIAKVFDAGSTDPLSHPMGESGRRPGEGRPYFVMELVRGLPITRFCAERRLPLEDRLTLFTQVCQAVQHAHQKGIIHRDLKPSNVLVTLHDGVPVPKVIDFGIAKATEGRLTDATVYTQLHQFIGTPAYMSPEQAEMSGLELDTRSDIYSLGVLLYELLTGATPFDAQELVKSGVDEMRRILREVEPPKPSTRLTLSTAPRAGKEGGQVGELEKGQAGSAHPLTLSPAHPPAAPSPIPADLDWIVMKCLEKDRSRRYETASSLAADLQRHLTSKPVQARPPSAAYRLQKAVRRHRLAFAGAGAVLLTLLVGLTISMWQAAKADRARDLASQERVRAESALHVAATERTLEEPEVSQARSIVAGFARELRANPADLSAASQLVSKLLHRPFALPAFKSFRNAMAFSTDGLRVLTIEGNRPRGIWRVLDVHNGKPLTDQVTNVPGTIEAWFSPDEQSVMTFSEDAEPWIRVWDGHTGLPFGPGVPVERVPEFSPDSQRIVESASGVARVWDIASGKLLSQFGHLNSDDRVIAVLSPDSRRAITRANNTTQVWDARTGNAITEPILAVEMPEFSPDGLRIVGVLADGTAQLWDSDTGRPTVEPFYQEGGIMHATFGPDGLQVLTVSHDFTLQIWDTQTGEPTIGPLHHEGAPQVLYRPGPPQFSPNGRYIVSAAPLEPQQAAHMTVRIWDARSGQSLANLTNIAQGNFRKHVRFSPDGLRLVTPAARGREGMQLWDIGSGQLLAERFFDDNVYLYSVDFSPDGQRIMFIHGAEGTAATAETWEVPVVPVPVPSWFLDWAEARAGRRIGPDGQEQAVPAEEQLRQFQLAAARTDTNFFTRLAQWVQADPATRTNVWFTP